MTSADYRGGLFFDGKQIREEPNQSSNGDDSNKYSIINHENVALERAYPPDQLQASTKTLGSPSSSSGFLDKAAAKLRPTYRILKIPNL